MKNWNIKTIIGLGIGLTLGNIIFDYLSNNSIGWFRAIFAGALVVGSIYMVKRYHN